MENENGFAKLQVIISRFKGDSLLNERRPIPYVMYEMIARLDTCHNIFSKRKVANSEPLSSKSGYRGL